MVCEHEKLLNINYAHVAVDNVHCSDNIQQQEAPGSQKGRTMLRLTEHFTK